MYGWLLVVEQARKQLCPKAYQEWCFIVGTNGTPDERAKLGLEALELLTYIPPVTVELRYSSRLSNDPHTEMKRGE